MKTMLMWRSVLICLIVSISISQANYLHARTTRQSLGLEHMNSTVQKKHLLLKFKAKLNGTFVNANDSRKWVNTLNNTEKHDNKSNSSDKKHSSGCQGDESPAICHTYIHNMYQFYSTIGGYLMLAIVFIGVSFLIITYFHGRHIVKTNQHVVGTIAKWDAIQHRKQQARERNGNWI